MYFMYLTMFHIVALYVHNFNITFEPFNYWVYAQLNNAAILLGTFPCLFIIILSYKTSILTQHQNGSTLQSIQGNHLAHKTDIAMNCLRLFLVGQPYLILHLKFWKKKIFMKIKNEKKQNKKKKFTLGFFMGKSSYSCHQHFTHIKSLGIFFSDHIGVGGSSRCLTHVVGRAVLAVVVVVVVVVSEAP